MASDRIRDTWGELLETTKHCQALFEDVQTDIMEPDQFKYPLALASHQLPGNDESMSIPKILKWRLEQIKSREIRILIAGEVSVGKSTLLNKMMREDYIPTRFTRTTKVICEIHDCFDRTAVLQFEPLDFEQPRDVILPLYDDPKHDNWQTLRDSIKTRKYDEKQLKKVLIKWPLDMKHILNEGPEHQTTPMKLVDDSRDRADSGMTMSLSESLQSDRDGQVAAGDINVLGVDSDRQCSTKQVIYERRGTVSLAGDEVRDEFNVIFVDTPGITSCKAAEDREVFDEITADGAKYQAFILVIKDPEIRKEGLQALMEDIEESIKQRTDMIHPECILFIVNQFDSVPQDEQDEVMHIVKTKLLEKWPRIDVKDIVFVSATKNLRYTGSLHTTSLDFVSLVRDFVTKVIRISIEEHCLWVLNLLDVIKAITTSKEQLAALKPELDRNLNRYREEANSLSVDLNLKPYNALDQVYRETSAELFTHLAVPLDWNEQDLDRTIPSMDTDWSALIDDVDAKICEKILEKKSKEIELLRQKYQKKWEMIYKTEAVRLKRIQDCLEGLKYNDQNSSTVKEGVAVALIPAVLSGAIRVSPLASPFIFLAVPLLPIPLVIKSFVDEYKGYKNEQLRVKLKQNKVQFFIQRTSDLSELFRNCLDIKNVQKLKKSPLFCKFFGLFPKNVLLQQVEELERIIEMLNKFDSATKFDEERTCNRYLARIMEIYTNGVLVHNINKDRIHWMIDPDGKACQLGNNGRVYQAKMDLIGYRGTVAVAVKELKYKRNAESQSNSSIHADLDMYRECFLLRQLSKLQQCENIVKFYGSSCTSTQCGSQITCTLGLVFELCDGTLDDIITETHRSEDEILEDFKWYACETTKGLEYLHSKNIIHRDMKPSNCLIKASEIACEDGQIRHQVKLADFGAAKQNKLICTAAHKRGTIVYWAPEVLENTSVKCHSKASDVYSLGLILWELWFRQYVWDKFTLGKTPNVFPSNPEAKSLLQMCLKQRLDVALLLQKLENFAKR